MVLLKQAFDFVIGGNGCQLKAIFNRMPKALQESTGRFNATATFNDGMGANILDVVSAKKVGEPVQKIKQFGHRKRHENLPRVWCNF